MIYILQKINPGRGVYTLYSRPLLHVSQNTPTKSKSAMVIPVQWTFPELGVDKLTTPKNSRFSCDHEGDLRPQAHVPHVSSPSGGLE